MAQALWLLLLALMTRACAGVPAAPIGTSVLITGFHDIADVRTDGLTPCEHAVWMSAAGYHATTIAFVVTIYAEGDFNNLTSYFYKEKGLQVPVNSTLMQRWQEGLARCFKSAVDAGFEVMHILPHVDPHDMTGRGMWRNVVKFSPTLKVGPANASASYFDALIVPVCNAINTVVPFTTTIQFAVAGEQGLSVFAYPQRWMDVIASTRALLSWGGQPRPNVQFGVSFNWDKVCGCVVPGEPDPILYNNTYAERFDNFTSAGGMATIDLPGVMQLLNSSDFIGASSYSPLPLPTTLSDMGRTEQTIAYELSFFNISLSQLLKQNISFIYSEQGVGGCDGRLQVAPNLTFLSGHPYMGVWGYDKSHDPWSVPRFKQYRREMHSLMSNWAAQGGDPNYRIDNIYMWSVGSWDILGVHYSSTNSKGTYADPYLQQLISTHNAYAAGVPGYSLSNITAYLPPGNQTITEWPLSDAGQPANNTQ